LEKYGERYYIMAGIYKQNFMGQAGFIWWVGVVENRKDPLKIGRCQVRIFGWHTADLRLIPSADLPWAHPVMPINNSTTFTTPKEGDYVMGFFFDGESGQFPGYLGVIPGIPQAMAMQQAEAPQTGFQDLRTSAQLASSPAPAIVEVEKDGSGTTVTNKPAPRNPSLAGFPNINPAAINSPLNPPASVAQQYANQVTGIAGPSDVPVTAKIAAGAQGAAAKLGAAVPALSSLLPKAADMAASIGVKIPQSALDKAQANLASAQATLSSPETQAKIDAGIAETNAKLAKAQESVNKQLAAAEKAAANASSQVQNSNNKSLTDLNSDSNNAAGSIFDKLKSFAPSNINTKTPVVVDTTSLSGVTAFATDLEVSLYKDTPNEKLTYSGTDTIIWDRVERERTRRKLPSLATIGYPRPPDKTGTQPATPKANIGAVAPAPLVNKVAPNPIPDQVPMEKVGSTQKSSLENSITLYEQMVTKDTDTLLTKLNAAKTYDELVAWVDEEKRVFAKWNSSSAEIEASSGDSTVFTSLYSFTKKKQKQLSTAVDSRVATIKSGGN